MTKLNVAVAGSSGRMGCALVEAVLQADDLRLHAALDISGSPQLKKDAGEFCGSPCKVFITDDVPGALEGTDVFIDFTRPEGTLKHLELCRSRGVKMVIGTTGFTLQQKQKLSGVAEDIAIVFAPNMSAGVNVVFKLLETAAKTLNQGYDVEIIEAHHRHKTDAPSGTALRMGEVIANSQGRNLAQSAVYGRQGVTGERSPSTIGFASVRGGDIVGDHTVLFAGNGERIEITHKATSRATFAMGALRAARFLKDKKNGLFDMLDVLGLR
ncbi:MAG TPA: 4-hydroxy-tetrahydrodipicolinate reductase [Burkholderiales bacterium]|nr:4-hydroxy-tetrahydrodipicolinate reductase [Burkholderiales bacterium]